MTETGPIEKYDTTRTPHETSHSAEILGQQIFAEGAGYIYGTLTGLKKYSRETTTGNKGHDWGFPFIQGIRHMFAQGSDDQNTLCKVMGECEGVLTPEMRYNIDRLSGGNTHFWVKENPERKTKEEPTGEVEPYGRKPWFGKQQTRPITKKVPFTYKDFSVPEGWKKYTFAGLESNLHRRFHLRILVPSHIAESIDEAVAQDPRIPFEIAKDVCKRTVEDDVLGTDEEAQIRLREPSQVFLVDRTIGKGEQKLIPLSTS